MNFSTFGPFAVPDWSQTGLKEFWEAVRAAQEKLNRREKSNYPTNLCDGIGVYIFVVEEADGNFMPWYVGKTDRGYGLRFTQHRKGGKKLARLVKSNPERVRVFIIARVTSSGKLKRVTEKMRGSKGLRSIDRVEFALIGSCLMKNPDLLNRKEKIFHEWLHVPGYVGSDPKDYDAAARKLAKMLRT